MNKWNPMSLVCPLWSHNLAFRLTGQQYFVWATYNWLTTCNLKTSFPGWKLLPGQTRTQMLKERQPANREKKLHGLYKASYWYKMTFPDRMCGNSWMMISLSRETVWCDNYLSFSWHCSPQWPRKAFVKRVKEAKSEAELRRSEW